MKLLKKLNQLFFYEPNCERVVWQTVKHFKLSVSHESVRSNIEDHPDYPSLLTVSDVLTGYGIKTLALKVDFDEITEYCEGAIVQVENGDGEYFSLVKKIENQNIIATNPQSGYDEKYKVDEFRKMYKGYILLMDASEASIHNDHAGNQKGKRDTAIFLGLTTAFLCLWIGTFIYSAFSSNEYYLELNRSLFFLLCGLAISSFLLWYEVDKSNPVLKQVCSGSAKTSCGSVLSSKGASIFGIKWSNIGFSFFSGGVLYLLLVAKGSLVGLRLVNLVATCALIYVPFSIYYQAKIVRKWCALCLAIQITIILMNASYLFSKSFQLPINEISIWDVIQLITCYLFMLFVGSNYVQLKRRTLEKKKFKIELQKLKHNDDIFHSLLNAQPNVSIPDRIGIVLGNPSGKYKITKVCNPYCGPCAKAHPEIEELLKSNPEVQVQIIFTATTHENDYRTRPVLHMLSVAESLDQSLTKKAIDDWYLSKEKDIEAYSAKYPLGSNLDEHTKKVSVMDSWCKSVGIKATPTFFINGFQLPNIYSVSDLKYFFSV